MATYSRKEFIKMAGLGSLGLSLGPAALANQFSSKNSEFMEQLFIGSYSKAEEPGIHLASFNMETAKLSIENSFNGVENPSYLAPDARNQRLYAVSETGTFEGEADSGGVFAYAVEGERQELELLNKHASEGAHPCYIATRPDKPYVVVANYSGGNIALLPRKEDGSLEEAADLQQHKGSGPNKQRQKAPHAHFVNFDPFARYVIAIDLGIDKVVTYKPSATSNKLTKISELEMEPGAGPRHLAFHPNGKQAFIVNELHSTVTAANYNPESGRFTNLQTLTTLPSDFSGENSCADIHVHPNGHFLYASNRGHNSIALFRIKGDNGNPLEPLGQTSVEGKTPRNFVIHPSGKFLLAANQNSNNITVFEIDPQTGKLSFTGNSIEVSKPVCLKFWM